MANDPFLPQRIQRAYEELTQRFYNEDVKREVLARLIRDGSLSDDDWKQANKTAIQLYITEQEAQTKASKESEELKKAYETPDSKIPQLWRSKNTQPERITQYLNTYNLEALEKFLTDLKARPLHYNSLFPKGELVNVITFMENALEKRKLDKTASETTKTESQIPSNPNEKTKPYTT